jgi:hypothetical protein
MEAQEKVTGATRVYVVDLGAAPGTPPFLSNLETAAVLHNIEPNTLSKALERHPDGVEMKGCIFRRTREATGAQHVVYKFPGFLFGPTRKEPSGAFVITLPREHVLLASQQELVKHVHQLRLRNGITSTDDRGREAERLVNGSLNRLSAYNSALRAAGKKGEYASVTGTALTFGGEQYALSRGGTVVDGQVCLNK